MSDENIIDINGSSIEISKSCSRVYLKKLYAYKVKDTICELEKIAEEQKLSKIFARVPSDAKEIFLNNEYKIEAHIPGFYKNEKDVYFMGKFLMRKREICHDKEIIEDVLKKSLLKTGSYQFYDLPKEFSCKKIDESQIEDLIELYKDIFETYPSPIFEADYIAETMHNNDEYLGIWQGKKLVATAEIEKDFEAQNVELTAFAILPEYRGNNYPTYLINELEKILQEQNFKTAYAIARATSYGMNIAFAKTKYIYAGTLINNTCIGGNLEHMHVWYKKL